jgi:hypothetical protein
VRGLRLISRFLWREHAAGFQQVEDNLVEVRILEREAHVQDEAVKAMMECREE